tara:strand:- start:284 stop:1060 length:777 start_codon:yes stop_codon:yes gene_type:complete
MKNKLLLSFSLVSILAYSQTVPTAYSPLTGQTWMDRNLGAESVATSFDDVNSFGDLYQWGRMNDGHQLRNSSTTNSISSTNSPNHANFILGSSDWLLNPDNNLWQGVNGENNPCPEGFRIPTEEEFEAERLTWSSNDASGAFKSPLKLSVGGARSRMSGAIGNIGTFVGYRTSTINGAEVRLMGIALNNSFMGSRDKADGNCIRCIQDEGLSIEELNYKPKNLVRIIDILGRTTEPKPNTILFYIYDDGSVERKKINF